MTRPRVPPRPPPPPLGRKRLREHTHTHIPTRTRTGTHPLPLADGDGSADPIVSNLVTKTPSTTGTHCSLSKQHAPESPPQIFRHPRILHFRLEALRVTVEPTRTLREVDPSWITVPCAVRDQLTKRGIKSSSVCWAAPYDFYLEGHGGARHEKDSNATKVPPVTVSKSDPLNNMPRSLSTTSTTRQR